jgi:hypothetical protein
LAQARQRRQDGVDILGPLGAEQDDVPDHGGRLASIQDLPPGD